MSPAADSVIRRLDAVRQTWWLCSLLATAVLAVCVSFGLLLVFMLGDALLRFSQGWLAILFAVWLGVTLAVLVLVVRRLAQSHRSLEATARRVEFELPELGSDLINVVQLSSEAANGDRAFCEAAVGDAAARLARFRFETAASQETRWQRFCYCMQTPRDLVESLGLLALLVGVALVCQMVVPNWGSAASRLLKPWTFVPSVGSVQIVKVTPGDAEILLNSSLEVSAEINNPHGTPYQATLFVAEEDQRETALAMTAEQQNALYKATLPAVTRPLKYRLEIGDSQTGIYTVKVRERPTIQQVEVTLHYPKYLGRAPGHMVQKDCDLEAPQYTIAELRIRPSTPITRGQLEFVGRPLPVPGRVEQEGGLLVARLPLVEDGAFTVKMANSAGHVDSNPRVNRVHVIPDRPPTVELVKPARQETAAPGEAVPVLIRAGDDYGVGSVRLEMRVQQLAPKTPEQEPSAPTPEDAEKLPLQVVREWKNFEAGTALMLSHRLQLSAGPFKPGQTVLLRAVAWDNRRLDEMGQDLQPQRAESGWHAIRLVSPEAKAATASEQLEALRAAVWKILEKQVRARMLAAAILKKEQFTQRAAAAADVRTQQVEIQKQSAELAQPAADDKEDRRVIRRILGQLAGGEMLQAVRQGDELVRVQSLDGFQQPVPELVATQDRIIAVLRKLLDAAREAQREALAEMGKRPGGDLPEETQKKLEEMAAKLEEFLKQQKKVIEASENLAKKPVEDFTEEEEQLLKTLAASQDEWSKFMKELASDLSRLPEQDFANASVAKELVEIQTELKMAEDALLKKSADIAVPLEQLGYERAEEMTTNLEKWLPDTPDRERWSQEEALTDADKEAPMAELPGELEDLIGDLMEEEEDLFDEMEDISSSAADSLDKGAGWDALDGPISNMSARGVTGNRLPNTNEIGGRAGEGRQGKSSGEFVGDEAVGKGGRRTPSRLTPDPYVRGQIRDHSRDPSGGATGGGKESGQGGEGLEGPTPGSPGPRELHRLADKQAQLRNQAEAIDLKFQVANFHRTDLKKMIELMRRVESDLKAGSYQNALRQRRVLAEGLGNVKQYLGGEFQVRRDASANLPADIQKEILGGMHEPSPAGWEQLNRQYFERLSSGGNKQ
ncbi:MAG: hypothetical protein ACUVUC_01990 [Thermoguttaceae bacterium]